jgi:hypothetical protein
MGALDLFPTNQGSEKCIEIMPPAFLAAPPVRKGEISMGITEPCNARDGVSRAPMDG